MERKGTLYIWGDFHQLTGGCFERLRDFRTLHVAKRFNEIALQKISDDVWECLPTFLIVNYSKEKQLLERLCRESGRQENNIFRRLMRNIDGHGGCDYPPTTTVYSNPGPIPENELYDIVFSGDNGGCIADIFIDHSTASVKDIEKCFRNYGDYNGGRLENRFRGIKIGPEYVFGW